jgi:hypothetical protein
MFGYSDGNTYITANARINAAGSAWVPDNSGFGGTNYSYRMYMPIPYSPDGFIFDVAAYPYLSATIPSWVTVFRVDANGNATFRGSVTPNSDIRLKENIVTIDSALDKVKALRGVYYNRIDVPEKRLIGLIAQEVEPILPEVVFDGNTKEKIKSLAYQNMVALLIEAMKEQQVMITTLQDQVASQQSTITGILSRLP